MQKMKKKNNYSVQKNLEQKFQKKFGPNIQEKIRRNMNGWEIGKYVFFPLYENSYFLFRHSLVRIFNGTTLLKKQIYSKTRNYTNRSISSLQMTSFKLNAQ